MVKRYSHEIVMSRPSSRHIPPSSSRHSRGHIRHVPPIITPYPALIITSFPRPYSSFPPPITPYPAPMASYPITRPVVSHRPSRHSRVGGNLDTPSTNHSTNATSDLALACIPMNTSSDAGQEIPAYAGMTSGGRDTT